MARANWIEARQAELLPVPYFHVVFTIPHELNRIAEVMENKKLIYNLLFRTASDTLKTFGEDPDNGLGGKIGSRRSAPHMEPEAAHPHPPPLHRAGRGALSRQIRVAESLPG
jgi:hypothetical protein